LSDDIPNLCQGCTLEKDCCETMSGLWTTDEEYKPVFKGHEDKLLVKRSNNIVFLYMKENEPCPLWVVNARSTRTDLLTAVCSRTR